jgi:serine/threonine protein phosphatase PrpC
VHWAADQRGDSDTYHTECSHDDLLFRDGLTRHVPDERIRERLLAMTSARQVCEELLQDALGGGGRDNITIVVGRALPAEPPANG